MGEADDQQTQAILELIASPGREPIAHPTAVVVAHPDDETIGCGAQLGRFADLRIIHVTDGAPRRASPAEYGGWEGYRDIRAAELRAAVALAGVPQARLKSLGWPDQEASLHLVEIARSLADAFASAELVLTHAYEGGHPDHDATAFAVHAASALLRRQGREAPVVLEMPFYRAGPEGWILQTFAPPATEAIDVSLAPAEQELKRRMLAAHRSQRAMLGFFQVETERFRPAPAPSFAALPNGGRLHYASQGWGMTGERWLELACEAAGALQLDTRP